MMEAGGHHAALAETLCQAKARQPDTQMKVFAHKLLDEQFSKRFAQCGISTELSFDGLFYKHFHDGALLGVAGLQKYIRVLAIEYKQLLDRAIEHSHQRSIVLFLPCLNWEHGTALGHALRQTHFTQSESNVHIVACAMYSPYPGDQEPDTKKLWYKMAFEPLSKHRYVSLYCSEQELSIAYADMLRSEPFKVHPCYLMDWIGADTQCNIEQPLNANSKQYLLYMGDAKVDKGFNLLPKVLQHGLASTDSNTEFVIQFTLAWEYPEIMPTVALLKNWAKTEPRLQLHHGFWSNEDMVSMFRRIDGVICTYDMNAYRYKSSGLVWMLAFFNKPFIISERCWLSQEAERLNVPYAVNDALDVQCFSLLESSAAPIATYYSEQLFTPLIDWLLFH